MKKIYQNEQLEDLMIYSLEVIDNITKIINTLNKNYGVARNIERNLGGYVLFVENIGDIEMLKTEILKDILPEYTDEIICSEGVNYTSSLFLLSSDFSVVVIANEELSKFLLE